MARLSDSVGPEVKDDFLRLGSDQLAELLPGFVHESLGVADITVSVTGRVADLFTQVGHHRFQHPVIGGAVARLSM
jgi:hypothetical protein